MFNLENKNINYLLNKYHLIKIILDKNKNGPYNEARRTDKGLSVLGKEKSSK